MLQRIKKGVPVFLRVAIVAFMKDWKNFGIGIAFGKLWSNLFLNKRARMYVFATRTRQKTIKKYLYKQYSMFLTQVEDPIYDKKNAKSYIWMMWWQGIENAPSHILLCIDSVKRHARNAEVVVLDKNNIGEYLIIPEFIQKKFEEGRISLTHFSDYLRIALLEKYGGIWVDSSIYFFKDIPEEWNRMVLFSRKTESEDVSFVSDYRWTVGFLGGIRKHYLFSTVKALFEQYLQDYDTFIDYFLLDYFICLAYESIPAVKEDIDNIPDNNGNWLIFDELWDKEYKQNEYMSKLKEYRDGYCYYISWKKNRSIKTLEGKPTLYAELMKGSLDEKS